MRGAAAPAYRSSSQKSLSHREDALQSCIRIDLRPTHSFPLSHAHSTFARCPRTPTTHSLLSLHAQGRLSTKEERLDGATGSAAYRLDYPYEVPSRRGRMPIKKIAPLTIRFAYSTVEGKRSAEEATAPADGLKKRGSPKK